MAQGVKNYTIKVGIIGNAEFQRFQRGIDDLRKSTREASRGIKQMSDSMSGLQRMAGLASKAMALFYSAQGLKSIIDQADAMRNLEASFTVLRGSAEAGANMMERVFAIAKGTGAPINDVSEAVQRLSVGMGEMGASNAQISQVAETFIKLGRVGGASMADINGALIQFSQGLSSGKLQGDEFKAIAERLPLVMRALAEEMGVSVGELKKLGSEGKITADVLANSMINAADSVNDKFGKLPKTFEQATNNLHTMWVEFLNSEGVRSAVQGLADALSEFTTGLKSMTADIKNWWGALDEGSKYVVKFSVAVGVLSAALVVLTNSNPLTRFAMLAVSAVTLIIANWDRVVGLFKFVLPIAFNYAKMVAWEFAGNFFKAMQTAFVGAARLVDGFINTMLPAVNLLRKFMNLPTFESMAKNSFSGQIAAVSQYANDARGNISRLKAEQSAYTAQTKKAAAATKEQVGTLKGTGAAAGDAAKTTRAAGKEVEKQASLFEKISKAVKEASAAIAELDPTFAKLNAAFKAEKLTAEEYARAISELRKEAESLGAIIDELPKESLAEKLTKGAREHIEATKEAVAAEGQLVALLNNGAINGEEFRIAMKNLYAEMDKLNPKVKTFYDTMIEGIREARKDENEILDAYKKLNDEFAAGKIPLEEYSKGLIEIKGAAESANLKIKGLTEEAQTFSDVLREEVGESMKSAFEDGLINMAKTGKLAFKDMATSILEDIAHMIIRLKILEPLMRSLGLGKTTANARGNVWLDGVGNGSPYTAFASGGIISSRTTIGSALVGEAGGGRSEAIVPLRRHGGLLGVAASPVNINVVNNAGAQVEVSESTGNDGSRTIDIIIEQKVKETMGNGSMDRMLKARYGLRPIGG
jgi:tape measure domain-containing protein